MKKIIYLTISACLILSMISCSSPEEEVSATPEPSATATPTEEPTPEPTQEAVSDFEVLPNTNLLTGEATLSDEAIGSRPVAVMVNNAEANLPQYGLKEADIVFEVPVEGHITRMMALYADYTAVPDICAVRSCRYYYPIISEGFDAFYVHWGAEADVAIPLLSKLDVDNIDGSYDDFGLFDRDQNRLNSGYDLEHSSVFYGTGLQEELEASDYRLDAEDGKTDLYFNFYPEFTVPAENDVLTELHVDFGNYYSDFTYDTENQVYLKDHNGDPHLDQTSGEQISFTNLIVMQVEVGSWYGSALREVDVLQENAGGYLFTGGTVQKITWSKPSEQEEITFYDEAGNLLTVNTGNTYIGICDFTL